MIALQVLAETPHFTTTTALGVSLIIVAAASPLILAGIIYFLKKRLEHRQIMAAIEKGTPLSEIMPPKPQPTGPAWIKYAAIGVALLLIGFGTFIADVGRNPGALVAVVAIGAGAGFMTRGILHRKYYIQDKTAEEEATNAKE